jgi:hypothetical protein
VIPIYHDRISTALKMNAIESGPDIIFSLYFSLYLLVCTTLIEDAFLLKIVFLLPLSTLVQTLELLISVRPAVQC